MIPSLLTRHQKSHLWRMNNSTTFHSKTSKINGFNLVRMIKIRQNLKEVAAKKAME